MRQIRHIILFFSTNQLRKLATIILIIGSFISLCAQPDVAFKWSKYQNVRKYSQAIFLFQHASGYGDIIKAGERFRNSFLNIQINFFDTGFNNTRHLKFVINKNNEKILDVWTHKNSIFFLTQADLKNQRMALRLRIIKMDSIEIPILEKDIWIVNLTHFSREVSFNLSRKDSSVNIWCINPAESENSLQSITAFTYNYEMKPIDEAKIDLPKKAELCKVYRADHLDNGDFLIYTKEYDIRPLEKRGFSPNYTFVFYLSNPTLKTLNYYKYKTDEAYLDRGKLKWNNGLLEASGLFGAKIQGPKIGIWFVSYNFNTQSLIADTLQYFNKSVLSLPNNRFQTSLLRYSKFESFYTDYFIKVNPKNRIIIAEQFFMLPAAIGSSYTYNRFYGDILLLYLNQMGEIYNAKRLIKAQQTFNNFGEFSSYYLERKDTILQFFYNDNYKNYGKKKLKHLIWHSSSSLALSEVSERSEKKYKLADYKKIGGIIQVSDFEKINENTYLVYAYKNKKGKLGLMKIEYQD